jgi:malonyl-CoA O-methyltransferase
MSEHDNFHNIDKHSMRASFARAAAHYDEAAVLQREVGVRMLERLEYMRVDPKMILDIGAGTGTQTELLKKRFRKANVFALDIAQPMLRHAKKRSGFLKPFYCLCADMQQLPLADNSIDMLFSNLALQWATDLDASFAEFRRVLKPGGVLLYTTLGPDTLQELRASWESVDGFSHVNHFLDMHDIGDAMLRAGLAEPVMDVERITMTYQDVLSLMRDLKILGAHNVTQNRPRGMTGRQRFNAVVEAYEQFRHDNVLPATWEVVYGHAWAPVQADQGGIEVQLVKS